MTNIKIEDLPVMEDLSEEEAKKIKGGAGARKPTNNLGGEDIFAKPAKKSGDRGVAGVVTSSDLNPSL